MTMIALPQNEALAALLRGAGGVHEKWLNMLSRAADPAYPYGVAEFDDPSPGLSHAAGNPSAPEVAAAVADLLLRARADGHEAAPLLETVIRDLGGVVPPAPAPEPAPEPAAPEPAVEPAPDGACPSCGQPHDAGAAA